MHIRTLFFYMLLTTLSMVGVVMIFAVSIGLVSVPDPSQVAVEWARPHEAYHLHRIVDAYRVQP